MTDSPLPEMIFTIILLMQKYQTNVTGILRWVDLIIIKTLSSATLLSGFAAQSNEADP